MKFTIAGFSGAIQALHPKLLPPAIGADSRNQKPGRGDLRPWNSPLTVATTAAVTTRIYRADNTNPVDNSLWLPFTADVSVVRSYDNISILICGDDPASHNGTKLKRYNSTVEAHKVVIDPPNQYPYMPVGPPAPTTAPVITVNTAGTSTQLETLYYCYTWVWQGRESAPSPVSNPFTCRVDDTIDITVVELGGAPNVWGVEPDNVEIRIYRTQTGEVGDTDFFLVLAETTVGSTYTFVDDRSQLGDPLETTEWLLPDPSMTNLTAMWNGMLAGIVGGKVRFNVPFVENAWPLRYEIAPPDAAAVALGRWEQNLLVLTTAKPLLVTGTASDSLDQQPLEIGEACVAPLGVVSFGHGVAWPCTDGLAYFGNTGPRLLTAGILTRDDWLALNPETMVAGIYMGAYVCFYTDQSSVRRGFIIDPLNPTGIYFLDTGYDALYFDELQDKLFILNGTDIQRWDGGTSSMTATFRSKTFETPPSTFNAMRVDADAFPVTVKVDAGPFTTAQAAAIAASSGGRLTSTGTAVRYTVTINDKNPVRLPGGFLATDWVVQIETTKPVQGVVLASSMSELQ